MISVEKGNLREIYGGASKTQNVLLLKFSGKHMHFHLFFNHTHTYLYNLHHSFHKLVSRIQSVYSSNPNSILQTIAYLYTLIIQYLFNMPGIVLAVRIHRYKKDVISTLIEPYFSYVCS